MIPGEPVDNFIHAYAEAMDEYDYHMRIAKTTKSSAKRSDAAYEAQRSFTAANDFKAMLRGMGIEVRRGK